jgi:hypothetical protein
MRFFPVYQADLVRLTIGEVRLWWKEYASLRKMKFEDKNED